MWNALINLYHTWYDVVLPVVVAHNYGKIILHIYISITVHNEISYVNSFSISLMVTHTLPCILFHIYSRGLNILDNYLYMVQALKMLLPWKFTNTRICTNWFQCVLLYVIDKNNDHLSVLYVQVHVYMCRNTHRQETWLGKTSCLMKATGKWNRIHDLYIILLNKRLN